MAKRTFKTELDIEKIDWMLQLPTEQRSKELKQCDLNSLAKAMSTFHSSKVTKIANALSPTLAQEFIRTVKMHKGEIPFPKKSAPKTKTVIKYRYGLPILASIILLLTIFFIDHLMPK
ncbi:hypothetical protein P8629_00675 [Hydrogenovibrio sp. 3SP14C1]|uniref:hypothetical protein n=1 Tax=Hydrogenovibrio sp. 3SP14C1 TaxID=3038774 RepID=UPI0024180CD4|nr:hypothetical protein [Hydrogenovibrio sp. 3SP14C1]MDG4811506.1 hypothetical protein [Hydrogenovibrio sp. 3SP14C1]